MNATTKRSRDGKWPTRPLVSLVEKIYVGLPTSRYAPKPGEPSFTIPVLSVGDIEDGHLVPLSRVSRVELRKADVERFRARLGDVLLSCRGTVLKAAWVVDDMENTLVSSNLIVIRPRSSLMLPQLILALLRSPAWQETLRSRTRSSTALMQLTVKDVEPLLVPVPPAHLQAKLAALIDAADSAYRSALAAATLRRTLADSLVESALLDSAPETRR
jgi:restriction endonuclease S subunit